MRDSRVPYLGGFVGIWAGSVLFGTPASFLAYKAEHSAARIPLRPEGRPGTRRG
jgi:hypothetical protein